jgi:proteasome accessory factor A
MAIPKVLGIETEYGIQVNSPDPNPTVGASMLINAYVAEVRGKVSWDFEDESPGQDARGFLRESVFAPEVEMHLVNTVLTNGARYYVDHAHPEYSSPECSNPLEILLYDRAGERVVQRSMAAARAMLPPNEDIVVYKLVSPESSPPTSSRARSTPVRGRWAVRRRGARARALRSPNARTSSKRRSVSRRH